jgi:hydroxyacylglutathione hydrolase
MDVIKNLIPILFLLIAGSAIAQPVPGSFDVHWAAGAEDCGATPQQPIQVQPYEPQTIILRQSLCLDFEANFIYLLIGTKQALLIDTGAVAEPERMPLAKTVLNLLPNAGTGKLPLLVVHTHGHADHRAGDSQFAGLASVTVVPFELEGLKTFFGLGEWPNGHAEIDLGGRVVEVIPTPGHHTTHLVFYDRRTELLFSGDFMMPGRLLIQDHNAYRQSAARIAEFSKTHPIRYVLGGHIELDQSGNTFSFGSTYHPQERPLQMTADDLLALPAALDAFNGFYGRHPHFMLSNPKHNLIAAIGGVLAALTFVIWVIRHFLHLRRANRRVVAHA